ncbi:MAG TPA: hypothetical protein VHZ24_10225 [Pirellulales bacterium]|nr:hypothetical protein [Pirellulales bacterium]
MRTTLAERFAVSFNVVVVGVQPVFIVMQVVPVMALSPLVVTQRPLVAVQLVVVALQGLGVARGSIPRNGAEIGRQVPPVGR